MTIDILFVQALPSKNNKIKFICPDRNLKFLHMLNFIIESGIILNQWYAQLV